MGWRENARAAGAAFRSAGVSMAEVEDNLLQNDLAAVVSSAGDRLAITVAIRRLGVANQYPGRRAAVAMAKGGLSARTITAGLRAIFWDHGTYERLDPHMAERRAETVVALANTFTLTPEQTVLASIIFRHLKATTGADL